MSTNIAARIPEDVEEGIKFLAEKEQTDKSTIIKTLLTKAVKEEKIVYALKKYSNNEVSLGKAAEIADIPLADFIETAANKKVAIHYTKKDFEKDFKAIFAK